MSAGAAAPRPLLIGLIGSGIQRSLTPALQQAEAAHHGLRLHDQLIDLDRCGASPERLPQLIEAARWMGFAGLNITYPCKQAVLPLLDALSPEAAAMGAVNTVVFEPAADPSARPRAVGHNTDGIGWAWGLRRALPGADLATVVLLGAGGAGSAIAHAACGLGVGELRIVDPEPGRAQALADAVMTARATASASGAAVPRPQPPRVLAFDDARTALAGATGLIHATPTGMDKLPGLPLPATLLHPGLWVSEIVYFPLQTALLQAARAAGCRVADGGHMAVGQALYAFELFTGCRADAARMDAHFRVLVQGRGG